MADRQLDEERLFHVAIYGYAMPAKIIPLSEKLTDISPDLANQLCSTSTVAVEVADSLRLMNNHLFS